MDFGEVMGVVLPIVYVVLGVALVWFVIELVITVRKTRHERSHGDHEQRHLQGSREAQVQACQR